MKTTDPDTLLIKKAYKDHTTAVRLAKQLRKLPKNRPAHLQDKTWDDRLPYDAAAGQILCCLRSHQHGRVNAHNPLNEPLDVMLAGQAAWIAKMLEWKLGAGAKFSAVAPEVWQAAKRCLDRAESKKSLPTPAPVEQSIPA